MRILLSQKVYDYEDHSVQIAFSAGIAELPFDGATPQLVLKCADAGLYLAKARGPNRIEMAFVGQLNSQSKKTRGY
jgi:GGDEF domain-containing protein